MLRITRCEGNGQSSCKGCEDKGIWNRHWVCFLYKIQGQEGCYCEKCIKEIMRKEEREWLNTLKKTVKSSQKP